MKTALLLIIAGVVALAGSALVTPIVMRISRRREWYDIPNDRKIHTDPIPRLGGVGIVFGLLLAALLVPLLIPAIAGGSWPVSYDLRIVPLFLAFAVIHGMGLVDDFHNLDAILKLVIQIAAAALVTVGGFTISSFSVPGAPPIQLGILAYPITVFWLVAISNAMNLADGVDGLAGGIGGIAALAIGAICLVRGGPTPAVIAVALVGAIIGFLFFNFPPARIFMGDSGSLTIGFVLAALPLLVSPGQTTVNDLLAPATVLLLPIFDTIAAIVRRIRQGRPIHAPDKEHIHHRILDLGLRPVPFLIVVYSLCIVFGIGGVASLFLVPWYAFALLVALWAAALGAFALLNAARNKRHGVALKAER